ncbi:MAG: hypothetical protein PHW54_03990, partial [Candidatus Omnitrophica bacterium]|nr:hypothetical protein [Candidatus Omnitrophota bacterium]
YSTAHITLVANLFKHDYDKLYSNQNINEKFFYSPDGNKLGAFATLGLIHKLEKRKFDEVIILIGRPTYYGYRKAKLLANFSGAKKAKLYFVRTGVSEPLRPLASLGLLGASLYGSVLLAGVLTLFFIFIVIPLKLRKLFKR